MQKRDYEKTFRNEDFIRSEAEQMICDYISGCFKSQRLNINHEEIKCEAKRYVDGSFKSFLDPDFNKHLTRILPQLEA